jgi:hypothetical protein
MLSRNIILDQRFLLVSPMYSPQHARVYDRYTIVHHLHSIIYVCILLILVGNDTDITPITIAGIPALVYKTYNNGKILQCNIFYNMCTPFELGTTESVLYGPEVKHYHFVA